MADIKPPKAFIFASGDASNSWKQWLQQFEWYEIASEFNKKTPEIQCATFLVSLGPEIITIYNNFQLSDAEKTDLSVLKQKFTTYFDPKKNITFERYTFNKMIQEIGESFDEYYSKILKQSINCEFGALADELLRDKIVIGISDMGLRQKLLAEENLGLTKTINICKAFEQAQKQVQMMNNMIEDSGINIIKKEKYVNQNTSNCTRCGRQHDKNKCPAFNEICNTCSIRGHFSKMCKTSKRRMQTIKARSQKEKINTITDCSCQRNEDLYESDQELTICSINDYVSEDDWIEFMRIKSINHKFKLDTGARCNVMSKSIATSLGLHIKPSKTNYIVSFSDHKIKVIGEVTTLVENREHRGMLVFKVINKPTITIIGYKACTNLHLLNSPKINTISEKSEDLFNGLGCLKGFEYNIDLIDNPKFNIQPARKVPHAIKSQVKNELQKMENLGVIRKIKEPTPVVSPMVIVKKNNKLRICIDPTDVNRNIKRRHYPLPTLESITAKVHGCKFFTKLDCNKGFWQIKVSKETEKFLTFATPWGRYCCTRLPFGLSSAPEVYQEMMSTLLDGIENVDCSMDDVLIYHKSETQLGEITTRVLNRIRNAGLVLNKDKCQFNQTKLKFLGHIFSENGISADPEKVSAINKLKTPSNKDELQRILGMITYLHKFIPNLSEITDPLRSLMCKDIAWIWEDQHSQAFEKIKQLLITAPVLAYYDVNSEVVLSVDASSKAVGAALLQKGRPIAYATKSLTKSQQLYPQIEKEALAIKIGCEKFHEYIYGQRLLIETDHKPLETIFKKSIHSAPPRLQRILFDVLQYSPTIVYKKGTEMFLADTLSRNCIAENDDDEDDRDVQVQIMLPITGKCNNDMVEATKSDKELQSLLEIINSGWPNVEDRSKLPQDIQKYFNFRDELSSYDGLIFKGQKLVVPKSQIARMLACIHEGHFGIQSCQARARSSLYWFGMNGDIKDFVERCLICQKTQKQNIKEPIISKTIPKYPFQIVASDIFHLHGKNYIGLCDSYSGFFDFEELKYSTSSEVILFLKRSFALHGIPEILETDNGTQYASKIFRDFSNIWKFKHQTSSPRFPQANGLAERYVQTAKNMLKKCIMDKTDVFKALLNYRNTPKSSDHSPNEKLMSRVTNCPLVFDKQLLIPKTISNVSVNLEEKRIKQKLYADKNTKQRKDILTPGDNVIVQLDKRQWVGAKVIDKTNQPRSLLIKTNTGNVYRRNQAHIKKTKADFNTDVLQNTCHIETSTSIPIAQNQSSANLTSTDQVNTTNDTFLSLNDSSSSPANKSTSEPNLSSPEVITDDIYYSSTPSTSSMNNSVVSPSISSRVFSSDDTLSNTEPIQTRSGRVVKPVKKLNL